MAGRSRKASWATGAPFAQWIYTLFGDDEFRVGTVVGPHALACRADHGCTSWWVFTRAIRRNPTFDAFLALGYKERPWSDLVRYPAGEIVVHGLGLTREDLYLQYQGQGMTIDEVRTKETRILDRAGPERPIHGVARLIGPVASLTDETVAETRARY